MHLRLIICALFYFAIFMVVMLYCYFSACLQEMKLSEIWGSVFKCSKIIKVLLVSRQISWNNFLTSKSSLKNSKNWIELWNQNCEDFENQFIEACPYLIQQKFTVLTGRSLLKFSCLQFFHLSHSHFAWFRAAKNHL